MKPARFCPPQAPSRRMAGFWRVRRMAGFWRVRRMAVFWAARRMAALWFALAVFGPHAMAADAADVPADCPLRGAGNGEVKITAERAIARRDGAASLQGNVQIERGGDKVRADRVVHNPDTQRVRAQGNVMYSNCGAPDPVWFMSANELTLDIAEGSGLAKDVWLHVAGVPVFYLPRYRVSRERKSGLLTPKIGRSSDSGEEFALPLYLNLAPNHDAVLTPHYYSERGVQLNAKYRYLYPNDRGVLKAAWLDDDEYDGERHFISFNHRAGFGDYFSLDANWQQVSDKEYLQDLPGGFDIFSESYLRSALDSAWSWRGWQFRFLTEKLQRADDSAPRNRRPYEKRPAFSVARHFSPPGSRLNFHLHSGVTQFAHKYELIGGESFARGNRFHNRAAVNWAYHRAGFHFTPALALNHTQYKIHRGATLKRTLPAYSLRTGLVFGKNLSAGRYRHTIEPELFYLNIPRRSQDDIPLFDTDEAEFRFSRLFDENRFNGLDRIGDADRLTLALTSRLLHRKSGREALRLSLGRAFYFRDRRVHLAAGGRSDDSHSGMAGEFALNLNDKLRLASSLVWDTGGDARSRHTTSLSLRARRGRGPVANLFHRYRESDFEQAGASFGLPLGERWDLFASASRDLRGDAGLHTFGGVEYRSCCWSLRLAAQRRLKDVDNPGGAISGGDLDYDTFVGFQFSIRGLGDIGDSIADLLEQRVPGYGAR